MSAKHSSIGNRRRPSAGLFLGVCLVFAMSGCQGPRAYQTALNELQVENRNLEDQYFFLENQYRKQKEELARLRTKLGEPEPAPDDFESSLPGSYYSDDEQGVAADVRRGARSGIRSTKPTGDPTNPSISMPSESLTPDQFLALLEGGDLNASPPQAASAAERQIADATSNPSVDDSDALTNPGTLTFDDPRQYEDRDASAEPRATFVDRLAELPGEELSESLSRIGSSRSSGPNGANPLAVNPIGVSRRDRVNVDGDTHIETMGNPRATSGASASAVVDHVTTHLVIDPLLTRGKDFDSADGDDGIIVVFETRNAADLFVAQPGRVMVSLIDPAEEGEAQRIGLWEFSPEEIATRLEDRPNQGRGVTLNLTWPNSAPRHRELKVFVRFENAQGELLESAGDVQIAIPGDGKTGWSVRLNSRPHDTQTQPRTVAEENYSPSLPTPRNRTASENPARLGTPPQTNPAFPGATAPSTDSTRPQWRPYR